MIDKMAPQAAEYLANKYPDLDFQLKKGRFKVDWVSELPYTDTSTIYYDWTQETEEYSVVVDLGEKKISDTYQVEEINAAIKAYYSDKLSDEEIYLTYSDQSFSVYFDGDVEKLFQELNPTLRVELDANQDVSQMIQTAQEWQTRCSDLHLSTVYCQFMNDSGIESAYITVTPDTLEVSSLDITFYPDIPQGEYSFRLSMDDVDTSFAQTLQSSYDVTATAADFSQTQFEQDVVSSAVSALESDKDKGRSSGTYVVSAGYLAEPYVYTFEFPQVFKDVVQDYEYQFVYASPDCLISTPTGWETYCTKSDQLSFICFEDLKSDQLIVKFAEVSNLESEVNRVIADLKSENLGG